MIASMTWAQYRSWQEYFSVEPFGEDRADLRAGTIAATIANSHRDPNLKPQPFTSQDFMPDFDGSRTKSKPMRRQEWAQVKSMAKARAAGGAFAPSDGDTPKRRVSSKPRK